MLVILASCKPVCSDLSKTEMLSIVKKCDEQFSQGIKNRDSAFLANIYSDSAQYVNPHRPIIKGKEEIAKEWGGFLRLKEKPIDLVLNISDVRGNREIIYETGDGYTLLADSSKWTFNYVNVWRLQKDGSYKLEIDTYN
jgi:ketosteroid isomerase-like protein